MTSGYSGQSRSDQRRASQAAHTTSQAGNPTVDLRAHGRDERMRMQSFFEGQEFLYRLTKALASPPAVTP